MRTLKRRSKVLHLDQGGLTLVELVIGLTVLSVVVLSFAGLFTSLVQSSVVAKRKAVANSLATNQIEYLKSLPYDNLAVSGGSIIATSYLPASFNTKIDGFTYTTTTSINYVDDAFDGCLVTSVCRNQPPPASVTTPDNNPADYKIVHVAVKNSSGKELASVDTQIASRVAETNSTTGALVVTIIDDNGNPIEDASVSVSNVALTPNVNVSDTTDSNGIAIFYNLPPDTSGFDYRITGSKTGFSTLTTIVPSGSLTPTYPSQNIFTQLSSSVTLTIKPQGTYSLAIEAQNTSGTALQNLRIYTKGGYKRFSNVTNTTYYFDNLSPSDTRPTTDASGQTSLQNLVPGPYYFCGDSGNTSCNIGGTTYYLVASVPHSGNASYNPVNVPIYNPASPPSPLFTYSGNSYYQKVRLIFSTSSTFPRISTLSVNEASLSGSDLANFGFEISGNNLACNSNPASCPTSVVIQQGANSYTASCSGSGGTQLDCTVNLTGIVAGSTTLRISNAGGTYTSPADLPLGSINVVP